MPGDMLRKWSLKLDSSIAIDGEPGSGSAQEPKVESAIVSSNYAGTAKLYGLQHHLAGGRPLS